MTIVVCVALSFLMFTHILIPYVVHVPEKGVNVFTAVPGNPLVTSYTPKSDLPSVPLFDLTRNLCPCIVNIIEPRRFTLLTPDGVALVTVAVVPLTEQSYK